MGSVARRSDRMLRLWNRCALLGKVLLIQLALLTERVPSMYERILLLESFDAESVKELRLVGVRKEGMAVDSFPAQASLELFGWWKPG